MVPLHVSSKFQRSELSYQSFNGSEIWSLFWIGYMNLLSEHPHGNCRPWNSKRKIMMKLLLLLHTVQSICKNYPSITCGQDITIFTEHSISWSDSVFIFDVPDLPVVSEINTQRKEAFSNDPDTNGDNNHGLLQDSMYQSPVQLQCFP